MLPAMPQITTLAGIALEFETHGDPGDPPLLLVMGFGVQLINWPRAFAQAIADGGRYVITFDNRDTGLSQRFDGLPANITPILAAIGGGDFGTARELAPYLLSDMSDDAVGLLTALGIEHAHVVGASMGAMIAQTMAIEHPERLLTLTSMMSTTGEPEYGQSSPAALEVITTPAPQNRDAYIESSEGWLLWHSKRYPEREITRQLAADDYDRAHYPEGNGRQMAAMLASGSRADGLRRLQVPTLVIHGLDDTLIAPSGGERTAELVPGAKLMLVPDMGHDRPEPLWPELIGAILEHTAAVA
jgi:pimeloyl-ACP methyl ester carboxylesterase